MGIEIIQGMDNQSQPLTPIANQPPVKASNNLNFFKTLAYGFVIVSIGITIAVGGYLLGSNKTKPQPVAEISVTPSVSHTSDPTSNWQIYTNSQNNFTFKYPLGWDVVQLDSSLAMPNLIVAPKANVDALKKVNFQVGGGKNSVITFGPFPNVPNSFVSDATKTVTSKSVIIAGLNATEYTSTYRVDLPGVQSGDVVINSAVENAGKKYNIGLVDVNYKNIYYQILSTFKFTDQNQAAPILYKTKWDGGALLGTLNKSVDGGKTWKEILRQYKGNVVYSTESKNPNVIYAGDTAGNMMAQDMNIDLLKSTDAGEHWTSISKGITDQVGILYGVLSIAVDSSNSNIINVTITKNGLSSGNHQFKSSDGGNTWIKEN